MHHMKFNSLLVFVLKVSSNGWKFYMHFKYINLKIPKMFEWIHFSQQSSKSKGIVYILTLKGVVHF